MWLHRLEGIQWARCCGQPKHDCAHTLTLASEQQVRSLGALIKLRHGSNHTVVNITRAWAGAFRKG